MAAAAGQRNYDPADFPLRILQGRFTFIQGFFLIVIILSITACGCLQAGQPAPAPATNNSLQSDQAAFILQNVVTNASLSGGSPDTNSMIQPEDRTAAAICMAMDSQNPLTRDFAVSRIPRPHGGMFNAAQVSDLWETVYTRWTYVEDPRGSDYFSPASRTIALGLKGDCDDFAIVVASMIGAVGGNARIVHARNGTESHAYPEVYIGTTREEYEAVAGYIRERYAVKEVSCHITRDENTTRYWLNLDWWSNYPGGRFFADDGERTAYYPDGRWERVMS
jgi:hypothetical protein